jgi:hypothetical protein
MNNNTGNGLQMHNVGNIETKYSTIVDFENYLFLYSIKYPYHTPIVEFILQEM